MLPFTDIHFFIFAGIYVCIVWLCALLKKENIYPYLTFVLTLFYLVFYFKYAYAALAFVSAGFLFTRYLSLLLNHRLLSAVLLAIPMLLVKTHLDPDFVYFAGLSFVTFRAIQVAIDHKKEDNLNFVHYFNFLFFIPSLYIGPLDRYKRFTENTLTAFRSVNGELLLKGFGELSKGVLYKFVIAECILRYWLRDSSLESGTAAETLNDMYAYTLYLFFDFAGYSAMAVGMANLVGIDLPFNFNAPFLAQNPAEFWQRWHASLTQWLTDYFFKPFYKWLSQMKRLKKYPMSKQNIAIFFTFFLMAVWNGFEHNFIWSGVLYGVYSVVHNTYLIECRKKDKDVVFGNMNPVAVKYLSLFIMFNLVCFALYVFSGRF